MKAYKIQGLLALTLLSVLLPTILVAPFHEHSAVPREEVECASCTAHLPHADLNQQGDDTDCLICQLLGTGYVAAATLSPVPMPETGLETASPDISERLYCLALQPSNRAPPVSFCF